MGYVYKDNDNKVFYFVVLYTFHFSLSAFISSKQLNIFSIIRHCLSISQDDYWLFGSMSLQLMSVVALVVQW